MLGHRTESPPGDRETGVGFEMPVFLETKASKCGVPVPEGGSVIHPPSLPSPKSSNTKASPKRGLTTYGRLENGRKSKETKVSGEGCKDIWELDAFSQGTNMTRSGIAKGSAQVSNVDVASNRAVQTLSGTDDWEVQEIPDNGEDGNWNGKTIRKSAPKKSERKLASSKRSKRSKTVAVGDDLTAIGPLVFIEDDNDDDYNPAESSRKLQKAVKGKTVSRGRRTRSNTDDWELMPPLPKGRKSVVLKQLASGYEFERDCVIVKAAASTRTQTSGATLPPQLIPPSPFKVDLSKHASILPEEEKQKYDVFSPMDISPDGAELKAATPEENPTTNLPLPSLPDPQRISESTTLDTGLHITSTRFKEKLDTEDNSGGIILSKGTSVHSIASGVNKKTSKLGSRSKTLGEALDIEIDRDNVHSDLGEERLDEARKDLPQSSPIKRVRLKQRRGKTSVTFSTELLNSTKLNSEKGPLMDVSSVAAQKEAKKLRIVAASDDESPLSELDEVAVMLPKEIPHIDEIMPKRHGKVQGEIVQQLKSKRSKVAASYEEDTQEEDTQPDIEEIIDRKKIRTKRQKRLKKDNVIDPKRVDSDEQSPQPSQCPLPCAPFIIDAARGESSGDTVIDSLPPTALKKMKSRKATAEILEGGGSKRLKHNSEQVEKQHAIKKRVKKAEEVINSESSDDDLDIGVGRISDQDQSVQSPISPTKSHSTDTMLSEALPSTPIQRESVVTPKQLETPKPARKKNPHSPINGGKPPPVKIRVGLSRRAHIEPLHSYLRK